jgi:hypothetical protein
LIWSRATLADTLDVGQATVNLGSSTLAVGTAANVAVKGVDGASETRQGKV